MLEECNIDLNCNPCGYAISYMFSKYQKHIEMTTESLFSEIGERTSKILAKARKDAKG